MEVLQRTANRGSISDGGYEVETSVKLEDANNEWFYNASPTAGNRRTHTFSFWIKRTEIGLVNVSGNAFVIGQGQHGRMYFGSDYFQYRFDDGHDCRNVSRQFRDTSAWYHFVVAVDTNQSSASNRVKLYVNGESLAVDDHDGGSYPDIEDQGAFFSTSYLTLGTAPFGGSYNAGDGAYDMSGYLAEFCAVDGQQLAPTDFGEFDSDSGIWKPIDVSGINFGNQGFYLNFATAGDLGDDKSGNGNDLTENNLAAADQATDTPTNNFCTFNAINMYGNTASLAEGATFTASTANGAFTTYGTMAPSAGKWWWEGKIQVFADTAYACIGATTNLAGLPSVSAQLSGGHVIKLSKAQKWVLNDTGYSYGTAYADGDIINVGLDLDNRKFYTYKNGTIDDASGIDISSTTFDGFGSQWMPLVITYGSGGASSYEINFGGYRTYSIGSAASDANGYGTFEHAPPSGYYALCTQNLALYGG